MAVYRRSNRGRYVLILLVLTSITLLTLDQRGNRGGVIGHIRSGARDAFEPVQAAVSTAVRPVGRFFDTVTHYRDLKSENARLRREVESLRGQTLRMSSAERERQALLQLAGLSFAADIPTVAARVIANSASNFQLTVDIDHGTSSGVQKGMPVATKEGLVGRVVDVSRRQATVLLVTDRQSNVGVRLSSSGDVGVAKGNGSGEPLSVDLIDAATKVAKDEVVMTSGLQQSVFPPDVPVGRVRSAAARPGSLEQDVKVDPVVDLRRLQYVRVLKWSRQAPPAANGGAP